MSDYSSDSEAVAEPVSESPPAPAPVKKKREGVKMTEKQKSDLNKHMAKMKKDGMTLTEQRSHRMKMMSRMRKDPKTTARKAHASLSK
jgi:hypothetical protein